MAGFAARTQPSQGTAHAAARQGARLEDARGQRLVVVTLDVLGVTAGMADRIGAAVAKRHRVSRDRLLLASSHTHSGPVVDTQLMVAYDVTPQQVRDVEAYTATFEAQVVDVVGRALTRPRAGHAARRTTALPPSRPTAASSTRPDGPVDHRVPMLRVDVGGKPKAILFSYACHNTTLPASNVEWHGDYAGVAQAAIEAATARPHRALHDRVRSRCQPESARHARERPGARRGAREGGARHHAGALTPVERADARGDGARRPAVCLRAHARRMEAAFRARRPVRRATQPVDGRDPGSRWRAADDRRRCRCRSGGSARR